MKQSQSTESEEQQETGSPWNTVLRWPPLSAAVYRHQRDYLYRRCNIN